MGVKANDDLIATSGSRLHQWPSTLSRLLGDEVNEGESPVRNPNGASCLVAVPAMNDKSLQSIPISYRAHMENS